MASRAQAFDESSVGYLSEQEHLDQATTSAESVQETLSSRQLVPATAITMGRWIRQVTLVGRPPRESVAWAVPTARALAALTELPIGWNSHAARPLEGQIAIAAFNVLTRIMRRDTPGPAIVPTLRGGVQFEWHTPTFDLEITFLSPYRAEVFYEDSGGHTWEGSLPHAYPRLERVIAQMTA